MPRRDRKSGKDVKMEIRVRREPAKAYQKESIRVGCEIRKLLNLRREQEKDNGTQPPDSTSKSNTRRQEELITNLYELVSTLLEKNDKGCHGHDHEDAESCQSWESAQSSVDTDGDSCQYDGGEGEEDNDVNEDQMQQNEENNQQNQQDEDDVTESDHIPSNQAQLNDDDQVENEVSMENQDEEKSDNAQQTNQQVLPRDSSNIQDFTSQEEREYQEQRKREQGVEDISQTTNTQQQTQSQRNIVNLQQLQNVQVQNDQLSQIHLIQPGIYQEVPETHGNNQSTAGSSFQILNPHPGHSNQALLYEFQKHHYEKYKAEVIRQMDERDRVRERNQLWGLLQIEPNNRDLYNKWQALVDFDTARDVQYQQDEHDSNMIARQNERALRFNNRFDQFAEHNVQNMANMRQNSFIPNMITSNTPNQFTSQDTANFQTQQQYYQEFQQPQHQFQFQLQNQQQIIQNDPNQIQEQPNQQQQQQQSQPQLLPNIVQLLQFQEDAARRAQYQQTTRGYQQQQQGIIYMPNESAHVTQTMFDQQLQMQSAILGQQIQGQNPDLQNEAIQAALQPIMVQQLNQQVHELVQEYQQHQSDTEASHVPLNFSKQRSALGLHVTEFEEDGDNTTQTTFKLPEDPWDQGLFPIYDINSFGLTQEWRDFIHNPSRNHKRAAERKAQQQDMNPLVPGNNPLVMDNLPGHVPNRLYIDRSKKADDPDQGIGLEYIRVDPDTNLPVMTAAEYVDREKVYTDWVKAHGDELKAERKKRGNKERRGFQLVLDLGGPEHPRMETDMECTFCGSHFSTKTGLGKHQRDDFWCALLKEISEYPDLQVEEVSPGLIQKAKEQIRWKESKNIIIGNLPEGKIGTRRNCRICLEHMGETRNDFLTHYRRKHNYPKSPLLYCGKDPDAHHNDRIRHYINFDYVHFFHSSITYKEYEQGYLDSLDFQNKYGKGWYTPGGKHIHWNEWFKWRRAQHTIDAQKLESAGKSWKSTYLAKVEKDATDAWDAQKNGYYSALTDYQTQDFAPLVNLEDFLDLMDMVSDIKYRDRVKKYQSDYKQLRQQGYFDIDMELNEGNSQGSQIQNAPLTECDVARRPMETLSEDELKWVLEQHVWNVKNRKHIGVKTRNFWRNFRAAKKLKEKKIGDRRQRERDRNTAARSQSADSRMVPQSNTSEANRSNRSNMSDENQSSMQLNVQNTDNAQITDNEGSINVSNMSQTSEFQLPSRDDLLQQYDALIAGYDPNQGFLIDSVDGAMPPTVLKNLPGYYPDGQGQDLRPGEHGLVVLPLGYNMDSLAVKQARDNLNQIALVTGQENIMEQTVLVEMEYTAYRLENVEDPSGTGNTTVQVKGYKKKIKKHMMRHQIGSGMTVVASYMRRKLGYSKFENRKRKTGGVKKEYCNALMKMHKCSDCKKIFVSKLLLLQHQCFYCEHAPNLDTAPHKLQERLNNLWSEFTVKKSPWGKTNFRKGLGKGTYPGKKNTKKKYKKRAYTRREEDTISSESGEDGKRSPKNAQLVIQGQHLGLARDVVIGGHQADMAILDSFYQDHIETLAQEKLANDGPEVKQTLEAIESGRKELEASAALREVIANMNIDDRQKERSDYIYEIYTGGQKYQKHQRGCMDGSQPGNGKTRAAAHFMGRAYAEGTLKGVVITTPKAASDSWLREWAEAFPRVTGTEQYLETGHQQNLLHMKLQFWMDNEGAFEALGLYELLVNAMVIVTTKEKLANIMVDKRSKRQRKADRYFSKVNDCANAADYELNSTFISRLFSSRVERKCRTHGRRPCFECFLYAYTFGMAKLMKIKENRCNYNDEVLEDDEDEDYQRHRQNADQDRNSVASEEDPLNNDKDGEDTDPDAPPDSQRPDDWKGVKVPKDHWPNPSWYPGSRKPQFLRDYDEGNPKRYQFPVPYKDAMDKKKLETQAIEQAKQQVREETQSLIKSSLVDDPADQQQQQDQDQRNFPSSTDSVNISKQISETNPRQVEPKRQKEDDDKDAFYAEHFNQRHVHYDTVSQALKDKYRSISPPKSFPTPQKSKKAKKYQSPVAKPDPRKFSATSSLHFSISAVRRAKRAKVIKEARDKKQAIPPDGSDSDREHFEEKFPAESGVNLAHLDSHQFMLVLVMMFFADCVVCDEAHVHNKPANLYPTAVKVLAQRFRLLLTGTPIQNNVDDLANSLWLLAPRGFYFNYSLTELVNFYGQSCKEKWLNELSALMIRHRTKDLPVKQQPPHYRDIMVWLKMPNWLWKAYNVLANASPQFMSKGPHPEEQPEIRATGGPMNNEEENPHSGLFQLMQLMSSLLDSLSHFDSRVKNSKGRYKPLMLELQKQINAIVADEFKDFTPKQKQWHRDHNPLKTRVVTSLAIKWVQSEKRKLVIVHDRWHYLERLRDELIEMKVVNACQIVMMSGESPELERKQFIQGLNDEYEPGKKVVPETRVMIGLMTQKTGGQGINIQTKVWHMIILNQEWNLSYNLQTVARVVRQGQPEMPIIVRFLTENSIEEYKFIQGRLKERNAAIVLGDTDKVGEVFYTDADGADFFKNQQGQKTLAALHRLYKREPFKSRLAKCTAQSISQGYPRLNDITPEILELDEQDREAVMGVIKKIRDHYQSRVTTIMLTKHLAEGLQPEVHELSESAGPSAGHSQSQAIVELENPDDQNRLRSTERAATTQSEVQREQSTNMIVDQTNKEEEKQQ